MTFSMHPKNPKNWLWGSLSAIFNIDLDLDLYPMFASMEHVHMNRNIFNIDLDLDPNLMLHRSEIGLGSRSRSILKIAERLPLCHGYFATHKCDHTLFLRGSVNFALIVALMSLNHALFMNWYNKVYHVQPLPIRHWIFF